MSGDIQDRILTTLLDLKRDVGRLEGKFDGVSATLVSHIEEDQALEKRVGKVENRNSRTTGMAVAAGAIASTFVTVILPFLKGKI